MNKYIFSISLAILMFFFVSEVQGQTKNENFIYCEYLKDLLARLSVQNIVNMEKNAGNISGKPAFTVIVITPGSKKDSNAKIAQRLALGIDSYIKQQGGRLRPVIVETKKRKGIGRLQIYFFDEVYDYAFSEDTLACP